MKHEMKISIFYVLFSAFVSISETKKKQILDN